MGHSSAMSPARRTLLDRIADPANLAAAWSRVQSKGKAGGLDGATVETFAIKVDARLAEIRQALLSNHYVPDPLQRIIVPKHPGSRETRTLSLPTIRDKVAQEAVRAIIDPILERRFLDCSYGYRLGKGPQRAIRRVSHYLHAGKCRWVAVADIDDFFGSLNQDTLIAALRSTLGEEPVVRLLSLWMKMGTVDHHGRWHDVASGVHQGAVVSPMMANLYLHPFDEAVLGWGYGLVRYADDFVILCRERPEAEEALKRAIAFLKDRLGLRLNDNPQPILEANSGFGFLGVRFAGGELSLDPERLERIRAQLRAIAWRAKTEGALRALKAFNEAGEGWRRYYGELLPPTALGRIEEAQLEALGTILARGLQQRVWRNQEAVEAALADLALVVERPSAERHRLLVDLIHKARTAPLPTPEAAGKTRHGYLGRQRPIRTSPTSPKSSAPNERSTSPPPKPTVAVPKPTSQTLPRPAKESQAPTEHSVSTEKAVPKGSGAAVANQPKASGKAAAPPSVAAEVRARKRRHYQQQATTSELLLTTPGLFLGKSGELASVRQNRAVIHEVPFSRLGSITIASHGISFSSDLVMHCAERGIPLLFVAPPGRAAAMLLSPEGLTGELGLLQIQALAGGGAAIELATRFCRGKISNQINLVKYYRKYRAKSDPALAEQLDQGIEQMAKIRGELSSVPRNRGLETARGILLSIEGRLASHYWQLVGHILNGRVEFPGRERKGAADLVNSLLNYGYAILQGRVHLALLRAGLNPHVSFFHALQRHKPTLVYDLMEEFRAPVVDRTVLGMLALGQRAAQDSEGLLDHDTRKHLIARVHRRLATLSRYGAGELKLEEIIEHQARALARYLRDGKTYRPYIVRW